MDDEWYLAQIKIVDDYIQVHNGVPPEVVEAYHHGVRGWMSILACRVAMKEEA